jgi:hypothetical protein
MCCFARFYNRAKLANPRRDLAPDTISLAVIGSIKGVEPFASLVCTAVTNQANGSSAVCR